MFCLNGLFRRVAKLALDLELRKNLLAEMAAEHPHAFATTTQDAYRSQLGMNSTLDLNSTFRTARLNFVATRKASC
jgi:hypothetical protein